MEKIWHRIKSLTTAPLLACVRGALREGVLLQTAASLAAENERMRSKVKEKLRKLVGSHALRCSYVSREDVELLTDLKRCKLLLAMSEDPFVAAVFKEIIG